MTDLARSNIAWSGEQGFINKNMLLKYIADLSSPIYYLCGPFDMVKAMREILMSLQIDRDNIKTEEFPGY